MPNSQPFDRPAATLHNEQAEAPCLLVCEHASNYIPSSYQNLGLPDSLLEEHICWDPGALNLMLQLSQSLQCSAGASNHSRLLVDSNRPIDVASSIAATSEVYRVPGNENINDAERNKRIEHVYLPFHHAVLMHVERLKKCHNSFPVVGIHSFTPVFEGQHRPWKFSVMWKEACPFVQRLIAYLAAHEMANEIGFNEPYSAKTIRAHTTEFYTDVHNLPAVIFEVRQDLLRTQEQIEYWNRFICDALASANLEY